MAHKIVVIGGGLTGLAAAWELERLGTDYTLIEVRNRLGGSISTQHEAGFVLDGGAFVLEKYGEWAFLDELDLTDALESVGRYRDGELVIFRDGTQTLVDALAARLKQTIMLRMAVSSLGLLDDGCFGVCLENGLMMEAHGVIIAAPARYAERMLRTLLPDTAAYLYDYRYESIARISLGYRRADVPELPARPNGGLFRFVEGYTFPSRVPDGHVLIRAGVRLDVDPQIATVEAATTVARALLPHAQPVVQWATHWAEEYALTRALPEHTAMMDTIEAQLPRGMALVGSDYRA
ncbi:MAG: FAD-dependent oxidoreductase, partial [Chloroflexota bacterium]|nr:FAD-dependent oxidoreductase [Chloroflexota bacterium]